MKINETEQIPTQKKKTGKHRDKNAVGFPSVCYEMFYCHWLIKKLLLANGLIEYSQTGKDI